MIDDAFHLQDVPEIIRQATKMLHAFPEEGIFSETMPPQFVFTCHGIMPDFRILQLVIGEEKLSQAQFQQLRKLCLKFARFDLAHVYRHASYELDYQGDLVVLIRRKVVPIRIFGW